MHSGSAAASWAVAANSLHYAKVAAELLNCTRPSPSADQSGPEGGRESDSDASFLADGVPSSTATSTTTQSPPAGYAFLSCLKQLPVETLASAVIRAPRYLTAFGPTIDGRAVLPEDVARLTARTSESVLSSTTLLAGVTRNEGMAFLRQTDVADGVWPDQWRRVVRTYVQV